MAECNFSCAHTQSLCGPMGDQSSRQSWWGLSEIFAPWWNDLEGCTAVWNPEDQGGASMLIGGGLDHRGMHEVELTSGSDLRAVYQMFAVDMT